MLIIFSIPLPTHLPTRLYVLSLSISLSLAPYLTLDLSQQTRHTQKNEKTKPRRIHITHPPQKHKSKKIKIHKQKSSRHKIPKQNKIR